MTGNLKNIILFEDSVDEGTTRRGTDTPVHRPEKTAGYCLDNCGFVAEPEIR